MCMQEGIHIDEELNKGREVRRIKYTVKTGKYDNL